MAKQIKKRRVYPAESDPRQANGQALRDFVDSGRWRPEWPPRPSPPVPMSPDYGERIERIRLADSDALAREFGPWVRAEDGRWARNRRRR